MTDWTSPTESRLAGTLPAEFRGIYLALGERENAASPLQVHGVYRVSQADVEGLPLPAIGGLVLALQRDLEPLVIEPFRENILFADDERRTHDIIDGAFRIAVSELASRAYARRDGNYLVFVSLGRHISNVLSASVDA